MQMSMLRSRPSMRHAHSSNTFPSGGEIPALPYHSHDALIDRIHPGRQAGRLWRVSPQAIGLKLRGAHQPNAAGTPMAATCPAPHHAKRLRPSGPWLIFPESEAASAVVPGFSGRDNDADRRSRKSASSWRRNKAITRHRRCAAAGCEQRATNCSGYHRCMPSAWAMSFSVLHATQGRSRSTMDCSVSTDPNTMSGKMPCCALFFGKRRSGNA